MKKILFALTGIAVISVMPTDTSAQNWGDVPIIYDSYGHSITRDGVFSTGEAVSIQSAWGRNNITNEVYLYEACTIGAGNAVSKDYKVVGTDDIEGKGAFLVSDQDPILIPSLIKYSESYLYGITWDGTRIVGIISNPKFSGFEESDPNKMNMMYIPIYCDVDPDTGAVSEPVELPVPAKDFFGVSPQYCTATWISDDGKTILGQVVDNSGIMIYPIVYKQDNEGKWSYSLPSESLFNPDNLPVPSYPRAEMESPKATDYITSAIRKAEFDKLLTEWFSGTSDIDPYAMLNPYIYGDEAFMTYEEWDAYQEAVQEYAAYAPVYQAQLDKYYEDLSVFLAHSTMFLQSDMSMNAEGTLMTQTRRFGSIGVDGNATNYYIPYLFNLEDGTYKVLGDTKTLLQVSQILSDGTLIAITPNPYRAGIPDATPQHTYVLPAGDDTFIPIQDYIKPQNPEVYDWMYQYLYHEVPIGYDSLGGLVYKDMMVTGLVAVSDDFTAMSGGVDTWAWNLESGDDVTYFITGMTTPDSNGIEEIFANTLNGEYNVFNLQGVKVLQTKDVSKLTSLPSGIYVINGKKVKL